MSTPKVTPTGREVRFGENEIIVSKTDLRGIITYANDVFKRVSGYTQEELIGKPHNILRHPKMPRCVFRLIWERLQAGHEVFGYVLNLSKDGSQYWVFAHITPSNDRFGKPVGYHSNRRVPYPDALEKVIPLYAQLLAIEKKAGSPSIGLENSYQTLVDLLKTSGLDYDQFVFDLSKNTALATSLV